MAFGQFTSLKVTSSGLVPRSVPIDISAKYKDSLTGQTVAMKDASQEMQACLHAEVDALSKCTKRTLVPSRYQQYMDAHQHYGNAILDFNAKSEQLERGDSLFRQHQRFWFGIVNRILALDDAAHIQDFVDRKRAEFIGPLSEEDAENLREEARTFLKDNPEVNAPILIVGNPTFSAQRKGRPTISSPKKFIRFLSRFFYVVLVDEHNSSKVIGDTLLGTHTGYSWLSFQL
jgi:hypothetical protein